MKRASRIGIATCVCLLALAMAMTSVLGSSVHLKGGQKAKPSFNDLGLQLRATGELTGLGFGDVNIDMTATADVKSTCTNQGGNQAPGQNPAPITVKGSTSIANNQIKNGNVPFTVTTNAPTTPVPNAPGCPNNNWREDINDLLFRTATITVEQPAGTGNIVLTVDCTFSPPTTGGQVPSGNVACVSH